VTLLLDSHALVWWRMGDRRLGATARSTIESNRFSAGVSVASVWEIAIKAAAGRLKLPRPPVEWLSEPVIREAGFQTLAIRAPHAVAAAALPRLHGDPFDRMLIAQAQIEHLTIVTADPAFAHYDVRVLDARA
jgi:PIN domain nuclease of toxin-antitoxin system